MSPSLLSKRLRELEQQGVLERRQDGTNSKHCDYVLTEAGKELGDVIIAIGIWGQRWVKPEMHLENTDPSLLMWDMRRSIRQDALPKRRVNIQFTFPDVVAKEAQWWILSDPELGVDLCLTEPGFDVDLYVQCDIKTMTAIWMGFETVKTALEEGRLFLDGDRKVAKEMRNWLGLSLFAQYEKILR